MLALLAFAALLAATPPVPNRAPAAPPSRSASAAPPSLLPTPQFVHFDMADGLPSSSINAVAQDRHGFMWFGGSGGLSRYDGVEFHTYKHQPGKAASLSSNDITQLVCAGDGRLWISTGDSGLDRLDPATGRFEHWRHDPANPDSLTSDVVVALALDHDGSLWVGTRKGLDRVSADGKHVTRVPFLKQVGYVSDNPRDEIVGALNVDADGTLWIGTWSGLLFKRHPDGRYERVTVQWPKVSPMNQIWRINGSGKDLRIGTRVGLFLLGADGIARPAYRPDQVPASYVFDTARDRRGRLWMATLDGVVMDDPATGIHQFQSQPLLLGGLPGKWTWRVIRDREGGLWFAFYDGGVGYLAPGWENF
ncbi:MAG TPA: two-component regulator propeller domain-containing protein, partial [Rhodanobacter sp.]|nr:two-component regulator propeller domain-containing protein [Rhodanobacter sp.]